MAERILLRTPLLTAGLFQAAPGEPAFSETTPTERHLLVFPSRACWIQHAGGEPFVAGPNEVLFYNQGQRYRRSPLSPDGVRSAWFAFPDDVLAEAVAAVDPEVRDRPFRFTHGPGDARAYAAQREVVRYLGGEDPVDPALVEETMRAVLGRVLALAYGTRAPRGGPGRRRALVEKSKAILIDTYREELTLYDLAARAGTSVFHLCRVFRRGTGFTLHGYRNALRIKAALEDLSGGLPALARSLGYSSHSHFSEAFRRELGAPPSLLRRRVSAARLRELSARLG